MKLTAIAALFLALVAGTHADDGESIVGASEGRDLKKIKCVKGWKLNKKKGACYRTFTIEVQNSSWKQPFSPYFVMIHDERTTPLYRQGEPAIAPLARLAEDGNPTPLATWYDGASGVYESFVANGGNPTAPGKSYSFKVTIPYGAKLTLASMAINTNDCFVSVNGQDIYDGARFALPGLDAGSEENNESCKSIPGPACTSSSGNVQSGNGEGFVHIHRGVVGFKDIPVSADWRNPMAFVSISVFK
mmetsp:Transcript_15065/g.26859  ORF Transcript_15065/g.26859 Transcript_15065/m.26859 type:complete len:246 (+) Transcript_15065:163-900(+)